MTSVDVVVIGAGAAGLLAAIFAREGGATVTLMERTPDGGRKILISGGGRCNILPSETDVARFVTDSSRHSLRNILRSWPVDEQRVWFETTLGMRLVREEATGKLFPSTHRARDVRDRLVDHAARLGVTTRFGTAARGLVPPDSPTGLWTVEVTHDHAVSARSVVLATGGLSVPKTGSDGFGLRMAQAVGHAMHTTYPALTPLTAGSARHAHLAGVSLPVTIRAPGTRPRFEVSGGFLFTHRGYSGPVVLDASHLAVRSVDHPPPQSLLVQWTPQDQAAWERLLAGGRASVRRILTGHLPTRLADQLLDEAGVARDQPVSTLARTGRRELIHRLTEYPLPWTGHEGYRKAEVTGGGVALSEIVPRTMESRRRPGLFLCGELLDAFGPIGGHNFLWAWTTGRAAGMGAAERTHGQPG